MISKNSNLEVIKQVVALQNLKSAELEKMWGRFFNNPPEVDSRQYMTAKIAYIVFLL